MGDADRWLDVVRARFLLEVERSSHVDVYNALPGTSASHKWVTQDARALAKKLLQLWRDEVRNDPNDEKVRQVLTEAVMSRSGKPIDWDSLRKHFDRKPAAQNGDTFGTVHLSVALLMAAAKGIPAELGTHGRISIKGVSEADRRDAEDL